MMTSRLELIVLGFLAASAWGCVPSADAATPDAVGPLPGNPSGVIASAPDAQWVAIAPEDLLVLDLAPRETSKFAPLSPSTDLAGVSPLPPEGAQDVITSAAVPSPHRVVIQLIGPPYSQGWVANIRVLAAEHWWDGLAITRVQDNYVVQWGDPDSGTSALARPLPRLLQKMPSADYVAGKPGDCGRFATICPPAALAYFTSPEIRDAYADSAGFVAGWPVAVEGARSWPVHCYGSVGVGRDVAPDTGSGAELYAVIGQAPRQLDRNIAVVGRVIEGIEHLSALPRGTAALGFYATPEEQTRIVSIRLGNEVPDLPRYEYLSTSSASFAAYVHARANRQDAFYIQPAGSVDVCNVPVPVRASTSIAVIPGKKKRRP